MRTLATLILAFGLLSSGPVFASGGGDEHGGHHYLSEDGDHDGSPDWMASENINAVGFHAVNLLIFAGAIFYFGRRPVGDAIANRALGIRKELTESGRVRDEARQRNQELTERLDRIESELQGMRDEAHAQAANEEAKLIERANNEANRITDAAERSIRDEVTRARVALKRDAVALAVSVAESTLKERMSAEHQQALARDFLESIRNNGENRV